MVTPSCGVGPERHGTAAIWWTLIQSSIDRSTKNRNVGCLRYFWIDAFEVIGQALAFYPSTRPLTHAGGIIPQELKLDLGGPSSRQGRFARRDEFFGPLCPVGQLVGRQRRLAGC